MHFFDRHNHKLQIEDFELFIALLERLMAEQIRKQSAQVTTKFQRGNDGYLLFFVAMVLDNFPIQSLLTLLCITH